jgi:hypothetical protein
VRRAALVLALAALAGCGGSHAQPSDHRGAPARRPPDEQTRLQTLLDRRASALEAGSPAAYAATAAGAERHRDRAAARVAARLSLRDVRLQLRSAAIAGDGARLRVFETWGIRGVRGTYSAERRMRARRTPAGWRITAVQTTRGRSPWEVGDFAEQHTGHFVVLTPRSLGLDGLPASLEAGYGAIRGALPKLRLRRRYLVVVAPTAATARRLTVDINGIENLAAISDTAVREAGPARRVQRVLSQRLLVVWPQFAALSPDDRRRVVAHELTHAVLAGDTSGRTPGWLVEGIALYVSGDRRDDEVRAVLDGQAGQAGVAARREFSLRALSAPDSIARLRGGRQAGAYAYASAAAFALATKYGRRALLRLYFAFDDESLRGAPGPALVDRALRRTIGTGLSAFDREVRDAVGAGAAGTSGTSTTSGP